MIPPIEIENNFELAKNGTFRFADKKPTTIPKFRQYRKSKEVKAMKRAFEVEIEF
jgi:hypothetical protein